MSENKFDPNPRFENHFCHFRPWADHYKNEDGPVGVLARMLGYAWDERERLCKLHQEESRALALFQEAFITGIEPDPNKPIGSISDAMKTIEKLNERRRLGLFVWPK